MQTRLIATAAALLLTQSASAQVRCTMPNGVIIEQKLSNVCPAGARTATLSDGSAGTIREPSTKPPAPIVKDRLWRATQDISSEELGLDWPLQTRNGTLSCMYPNRGDLRQPAFLITTNGGIVYAINGTANSHAKTYGWQSIKSIWRDNPDAPGTKIPLTKLIERATRLCESR